MANFVAPMAPRISHRGYVIEIMISEITGRVRGAWAHLPGSWDESVSRKSTVEEVIEGINSL